MPKSTDDAQATEDASVEAAPASVEPSVAPEVVEIVLPLRVETFLADGVWSWRRVTLTGSLLATSAGSFETQAGAAQDAKAQDENAGLLLM